MSEMVNYQTTTSGSSDGNGYTGTGPNRSADLNHPPHRHLMEQIAIAAKKFVDQSEPHPTDETKVIINKQPYDRLLRLVEETKGILT